MQEYSFILELLKGAGTNAPLAWVCFSLFNRLQAAQEQWRKQDQENWARERQQLLADKEVLQAALNLGESHE